MNKENLTLRKAELSELPVIWKIFEEAIALRKQDGSEQWQDGYPNEEIIKDDIRDGYGYVLIEDKRILGYAAIVFGVEPAYNEIKGAWLTDGDYAVVHRLAVSKVEKGRGVGTIFLEMIEDLSVSKKIYSIKVDTNFDNFRMIKVFEKLNYTYCGEVFFIGAYRKAYEKILLKV